MTEYERGRFDGLCFVGDDVEYLRNRSLDYIRGFQETFGWQL